MTTAAASRAGLCRVRPLREDGLLPLVVEAEEGEPLSLMDAQAAIHECVARHLPRCGGILLRGFAVPGADAFRRFAAGFGHDLLSYEFGSTPRTKVAEGVYTSTEYPPHQHIPLHNEQAYTRDWPMKIWFYCMQPAQDGGSTPIADSRAIYRDIPSELREDFGRRELLYVRNYGNGLDLSWQDVFGTRSRDDVERYCKAQSIECEWKSDGELRTRQRCQATARHPVTGEAVWFNQAHLFHVSNLEPEVRETLLDVVDERDLPRNVYYGDGASIEDEALAVIRDVLERNKIGFPWRQNDILMLDNMLTAHGRAPFCGARKVIVAMAEPAGGPTPSISS
ncbi:MAG: TauD/TfdA family dioxygenase [Kiloniellaceae bacterium]